MAAGPAPPPATTDKATNAAVTTLFVDVRPWARVKIVPPAPDAAVPADALYAPFAVDLPPGTYTFESENGGVTRPLTFQVTVATGAPQAVTRSMPGFDATRAVDSLMARFTPAATAPKGSGGALHPVGTVPNANVEQIEARARGEHTGMIEFFAGNYQKSIAAIAEAEKVAPLSPRGHFYRACSLASLATRGKTVGQPLLREARRSYSIAADQSDQFKDDVRFISPRLLQLLKGS